MSVVVQELYSGLPAALSAERSALSDPLSVLGAKPEASSFVGTCRRLLPEHQSTHGLKIRLPDYPERLGKASHPGLMDLLGKQPVAAGDVVEDHDHTPSRIRTQRSSFHDCSRADLGVAEATMGVPMEDLALFPRTTKEGCCSNEKAPPVTQEWKDLPPSPSSRESGDLLQSHEEELTEVQVTPETLSDPMPETQGMEADGTTPGLFGQSGEGPPRVSPGVPLTECRPSSDANRVMTKVAISEANALVPREPLTLIDYPLAKEPWQGKEECPSRTLCAPFPTPGPALSPLQSRGDPFLGQAEGRSDATSSCPSAQQEQMDGPNATPKTSVDVRHAKLSSETSDSLFQGDLEFGKILWEESAEVPTVCGVGKACEKAGFSEWAPEPKKSQSLSQAGSNGQLPGVSTEGEGTESQRDHTYSCLSGSLAEGQKVAALLQNRPKKPAAVQGAGHVRLDSGSSRLHHVACLSKDECPECSWGSDGIRETVCPLCPWSSDGGLLNGKGRPRVEASGQSQPTSHDLSDPDGEVSGVNVSQMKPCGHQGSVLWDGFGAARLRAWSSSDVNFMAAEECSEPVLFCEEISFPQPMDTDLRGPEFTDSLLGGDPSWAEATLATQNAHRLLPNKDELTSTSQDCATAHGQPEPRTDVKRGDAGDTLADEGRAPGETDHSSDLRLATETAGIISGLDSGDILEVSCEECRGLGMSYTSVPEKEGFLRGASGARDPVASPACLEHLNPVGKALFSDLGSVRLSESCTDVETLRTGGQESFAESEGLPERSRSVSTPLAQPQPETGAKDSWGLASTRAEIVETLQTEGGNWGSELGGKQTWGGREVDETLFPECVKLVTDQSQEGNQIHPTFSSASHLKAHRPELLGCPLLLGDVRSVAADQVTKANCQMETPLCGPQDQRRLHCPGLFNQGSTLVPEAEASERSPFPWVFSEKPMAGPVLQPVTRSAEEPTKRANSSQKACLQETQDAALPAWVLLLGKAAQETSQLNTASCSAKTAPESTERPLKEGSREKGSSELLPGCLESPPGPLRWNRRLQDQPCQGKTEGSSSSLSEAILGTPSDAESNNQLLKCKSEPSPGQTHSQPDLPTFIPIEGQKSTEEAPAESFRNKEASGLATLKLNVQPLQSPGSCLSPEDEPSRASLSPRVQEHPSGSLLVKGGAFPTGFPFETEMETQTPDGGFPGGTSDLSGSTENIERHEEKLSRALQLFPRRRNCPHILCRPSTSAFQNRAILDASVPCLRTRKRRWQAVEGRRKATGGQKKPLEKHLDRYITDAPMKAVRTFGLKGCPTPTGKPLEAEQTGSPVGALPDALSPQNRAKMMKMRTTGVLKRSIPAPRRDLKLKDPGRTASRTRSPAGDRGNGALRSPFREPERPERSMDSLGLRHMEAEKLNLGFRRSVRPLARKGRFPPLSSTLTTWRESRGTLGGPGRVTPTLLLSRRQPRVAPTSGRFKAPKEAQPSTSPASLKNPSEMVPRHGAERLDPACALRRKGAVIWDRTPKQRLSPSHRLESLRLSRDAKGPKRFRELPTLAPPRNPHKLQPHLRSSALLPVPEKYGHQRRQTLPEMFSFLNIEFNSPWIQGGSCWFQMFSCRPVARGPIESTQMCFFGLDSKTPRAFGARVFPVSFRIQVDSGSTRNVLGREALLNVSKRLAVGEAPAWQASGWAVSFLLSQSHLDVAPHPKDAHRSPAPAKARWADAIAQSNVQGLQTILALLSPAFCRLWRKTWLRAPAIQTLTVLQLTRGLKGLKKASPPMSVGLASSVPYYALGKAPSLRSQQGLSAVAPSAAPEPLPLLSAGCRCQWPPVSAAPTSLRLRNNSRARWTPGCDQVSAASLAVKEATGWKPPFPRLVPRSWRATELAPPCRGLQIRRLEELEVSAPAPPPLLLPKSGKAKLENSRPQKVSQIRIRKTIPKPDPNLTPMGLPRPKRLKKTEFSLEEIYTNKNYKSPPATRCLETIFEEPKERNGSLVATSHQKRKRILEFQDFTIPRKRKARGRAKVAGSFTRAQKAALEGRELDVLLVQRLTDLETFFAEQEKVAAS